MATPMQQQALQRKIIYFAIIVVLFTVSVIHNRWVLKPQAYRLQLREESRGDVELTSSAVRLSLTGSRGLAVTMLWYTAMDKQKRGEYHELELLVKSITKLQPYFITPWLYQSWNISFNVAVECDRPRDKYYYISRGLELLAEGERRNRGAGRDEGGADPDRVVFPGHPELRHYMGFFYQLKIGTSDERLTMRSLIELSCIDPLERDSARFWKQEPGRRVVNILEFRTFCDKNPRLVRRLREQLKYESPDRIIKFLEDHKNIPSRFKPIDKSKQVTQSELKHFMEQFPILPPIAEMQAPYRDWPNPKNPELSEKEAVDVYVLCRTWYEFAQLPLPPAQGNASPQTQDYDKVKYRVPRHMVTQLFRGYPARAQVYIAETLESEGFFDKDGWEIKGWFARGKDEDDALRVGTADKYHSRLAWEKSFKAYEDFGINNGIFLTPAEIRDLEEKSKLCQKQLGLKPGEGPPQMIPPDWREGKKAESLEAHTKQYYSDFFRRLSNFNAFYFQAEAEKDQVTTAARKTLFLAEHKRKSEAPSELLLAHYDQAWTLYIHSCLKFPRFAQVGSMQEDLYEIHQRYLAIGQTVHLEAFRKRAVLAAKVGFYPYPIDVQPYADFLIVRADAHPAAESAPGAITPLARHILRGLPLEPTRAQAEAVAAQLAYWPYPAWREAIVRYHVVSQTEANVQQMSKVVPIKQRLGPLDLVEYYDGPMAKEIKEDFLFQWARGAGMAQNMTVASAISYPGHEYFLLSRAVAFQDSKQSGLITGMINATPLVVTAPEHGLTTGMMVTVKDVPSLKAVNNNWIVTVIDADTFSLNGSQKAEGSYVAGGIWTTNWQPLIMTDTRRITANRLGLDR